MFNTFEEVLLHAKKQYATAEQLSRTNRWESRKDQPGCFYSHKFNGIGCAIGCCVSEDDAEILDETGVILTTMTDETQNKILNKYFSQNIYRDDLRVLQQAHDSSDDVPSFRRKLDALIEACAK